MKHLSNLHADSKLSHQDVLEVFEFIGSQRDIILIKCDGIRTNNKYTVVITSGNSTFEAIRSDAAELRQALLKAAIEYIKAKGLNSQN